MVDNLNVWEDLHKSCEWGRYPSEQVVRFIARNYYNSIRNSIKILDFGCGGGANTWFLAREGFDVYAFDWAPSAVKKARKYLNDEGYENVHFSVQNGQSLNYGDNFFDCVVDNVCIYANKMSDIMKMYQEAYRILKWRGKIYSSCFGVNTDGYVPEDRIEHHTYNNIKEGMLAERGIAHLYTEEELYHILECVGFKGIVIDVTKYTDNGNKVEIFMAKAEKI